MPALASDDFNRADSATLGANWTAVVGTAGIVSNECGPKTFDVGTGNSVQRYSAISWPNDQYSKVTLRTLGAGQGAPGPAVRLSAAAFTGYLCYCNVDGSAALAKWVAGAFTNLAGFSPVPAAGDVMLLEAVGSRLRVYSNGVLRLTVFDSAIASGDAGLQCGISTDRRTDNWEGGVSNMSIKFADRVKETTTSTGTGDITLAGAVAQFSSFTSRFVVGDYFYYTIVGQTGTEWEVGIGHLSASTTLVRDVVLTSSNADALVSFSAGTKDVFCDISAMHAFSRLQTQGQEIMWPLP